jgi:LacI family transcriptional regulator
MNLKELAAQLGLSKATVSRALAGHTDISAQTRQRVQAAARAAGYTPAATALKLRSGKSGAIGIVLPNSQTAFDHPFYADLISGLAQQATAASLDLVITVPPPDGDEISAIRRLVEGRRVDGLVITATRVDDERIDYLLDRGFPFASLGRSSHDGRHPWIDFDGHAAMLAATRRLIGLGHRRIAYIGAPPVYLFAGHRLTGYRYGLTEARLPHDPHLELVAALSDDVAVAPIVSLLAADSSITAILCATDAMAIGALNALRQLGKRGGRDVSVIGYGDLPYAAHTDPPLTTASLRGRAAGQRLIELLLQHVKGEPAQCLQELWVPQLLHRQSDGPPVPQLMAATPAE